MHKDVMTLLTRMGLKDRERRIYMACLKYKDGMFIYELAQETRITRSTVDLTVRRLVQSGFLNKVKVGRRLRYFALAPEAVLFRQKQLAEDWEQLVPLLSNIAGQKKDMEILHFEGVDGLRRVYEDILLQLKFANGRKRDLLSFSSGVNIVRIFPNIQKAFINKRIKTGAWFRAISTQESSLVPEWMNNAKQLRAVKYIPEKNFQLSMTTDIYGDNVMMYSPVPPVGGVIIRNEKIADSMRALFNLMWRLLPEPETL
ncbi:MAG: BlaI/MecI/CopY family transcriptional regulator [Pseudomonadota bacterium]|nr:BlaI/MecI/CopY family transcriptional regulator [Pseudomonadota bacterium]